MNRGRNRPAIVDQILCDIHRLDPTLGDEKTRIVSQRFLAGDVEALLFHFMKIAQRVNASASSPATPSGMIPPRLKASAPTGKKP